MASQYCYVQYTPDSGSKEAINVALVTWEQDHPEQVHFLVTKDWSRVNVFARQDVSPILQRLGDFITSQGGEGFRKPYGPNSSLIWTRPAGSLLNAQQCLDSLSPRLQ